MIVRCIIGPDPQSENIHMGPELLMSRESSPFSFVRETDSEPNAERLHRDTGYPLRDSAKYYITAGLISSATSFYCIEIKTDEGIRVFLAPSLSLYRASG